MIPGTIYFRDDLHQGLGGERQRGISYPKGGHHVLLFSNPEESQFGYRDGWTDSGRTTYRYWGMWFGAGPMQLSRGNARIIERSGELYLFVKDGYGYRFEGRFEYVRHESRVGVNRGKTEPAIVFVLRRVE